MSQQTLADLLGYDVNYIGQVERAEKSPTLTTLMSISSAWGTRVWEFLKAAEERMPRKRP